MTRVPHALTTTLQHGRVSLALHTLQTGEGTPLLLLHALGGSAGAWPMDDVSWHGPVHALDFSGHGRSGRVSGGAYTPELLAGDADVALAHLGSACLAGAGLGAWIALLLAGARPDAVPAALLLPGAGLAGGGPAPDSGALDDWLDALSEADAAPGGDADAPDPLVRVLERDLRPVDYAEDFAARARRLLFAGGGSDVPPWWEAAARKAGAPRVAAGDLAAAFARLRALA